MVLQQLPLQLPAPGLHQLFQLTVRYPPSPAAGKILNKMLEADPRPGKRVRCRGRAVRFIGLFFLIRTWFAPSNLGRRARLPALGRAGMTRPAPRGGAA
jgi:hypothetical protein